MAGRDGSSRNARGREGRRRTGQRRPRRPPLRTIDQSAATGTSWADQTPCSAPGPWRRQAGKAVATAGRVNGDVAGRRAGSHRAADEAAGRSAEVGIVVSATRMRPARRRRHPTNRSPAPEGASRFDRGRARRRAGRHAAHPGLASTCPPPRPLPADSRYPWRGVGQAGRRARRRRYRYSEVAAGPLPALVPAPTKSPRWRGLRWVRRN